MANINFPSGFTALRNRNNGELVCEAYAMNPTHDAIYVGDFIERRSDGYFHVAQASSTTIVAVAAEYKAANSTGDILGYPTDGLLMQAQMDASATPAITDFDLVYDISATTGDTTTKRSKQEISTTSKAATATLPIKVLRVAPLNDQNGNAIGNYVKVECILNHGLTKGAGTTG